LSIVNGQLFADNNGSSLSDSTVFVALSLPIYLTNIDQIMTIYFKASLMSVTYSTIENVINKCLVYLWVLSGRSNQTVNTWSITDNTADFHCKDENQSCL